MTTAHDAAVALRVSADDERDGAANIATLPSADELEKESNLPLTQEPFHSADDGRSEEQATPAGARCADDCGASLSSSAPNGIHSRAGEEANGTCSLGNSSSDAVIPPPTDPMVTALLTDMYQITMAYAYWKAGKHRDHAVFDLLHRKNPFGGEFTIFAGLEECIRFAANFKFTAQEIDFVRTVMPPYTEPEFFSFLASVDCSEIRIVSIPEGSACFPRVPILRVEGPLLVAQLLETTFLVLVNYASLVATNAARHRKVAGEGKVLLEFGLRRAQGPDGGISASRYCYMGGFDATSNVEAGRRFGIPVKGTHSHAFVTSFLSRSDLKQSSLRYADGKRECPQFVDLVFEWLKKMQAKPSLRVFFSETSESELCAFISYAFAFPSSFQALVDTYDVIRSGVPNFCAVALALHQLGYRALGIRLDSGDLAYLSQLSRGFFRLVSREFNVPSIESSIITASNDINEATLDSLNKQGHEVDAFGIGTHLVTCYQQPALGCVYKLVEINGHPRIKLTEDMEKVTIPGKKRCFRLYGKEGYPLVDLLIGENDPPPQVGARILCRHPFAESKRAFVIPQRVEELFKCYWAGDKSEGGPVEVVPLDSLEQTRQRCKSQLQTMRKDHTRGLNPTPYKVSVNDNLYNFMHDLWLNEAPVGELV